MTFRSSNLASKLAGASAMAAALSMAATPAAAADLPAIAAPHAVHADVLPVGAGEANQWRRYDRYDRHRYRHRYRRGVDAGDVIAGVAVVGVLAAILGSSRNRDRDRYERRDRVRYDDRRERNSGYESRGIESAVDMCVDEVEYRDNRVENVDRADRTGSGWNVSGSLENGQRWRCFIDNSGEVRSVDYGGPEMMQMPTSVEGRGQLSDAAYRSARATTTTPADAGYSRGEPAVAGTPAVSDPRPAYPGGPLPGEEGYDENWQVDGDLEGGDAWEGDGRYTTAQAPDFTQG